MAILTRTIGILGSAGILLVSAHAAAQTQADFDVCNEQAKAMAPYGGVFFLPLAP